VRFLTVVLVAALVGLAAPSHAETWSAHDRRADVMATHIKIDTRSRDDDCPGHRGQRVRRDQRRDILGLAVDHGPDTVTLTLTMRDVARRDKDATFQFHLQTARGGYQLELLQSVPDEFGEVFFAEEPDYPDPGEIEDCSFYIATAGLPCNGLTGDRDVQFDQVVVTVPRACLHNPDWVRVGVQVDGFTKPTKDGRFTVFSDVWARHGAKGHGFLPPFGPRVRSS
jgi:hypothetical protein